MTSKPLLFPGQVWLDGNEQIQFIIPFPGSTDYCWIVDIENERVKTINGHQAHESWEYICEMVEYPALVQKRKDEPKQLITRYWTDDEMTELFVKAKGRCLVKYVDSSKVHTADICIYSENWIFVADGDREDITEANYKGCRYSLDGKTWEYMGIIL